LNTAIADMPPRPHPTVETAFLAPEVVLWDGRRHRVHHFNPSASAVWLCMDGKLTSDQITTELCEIFEMPREVIRPDVDDALAEFVRLGLLASEGESDNGVGLHQDVGLKPGDGRSPAGVSNHEGIVLLGRPPDP
jgi:hypothetical protein